MESEWTTTSSILLPQPCLSPHSLWEFDTTCERLTTIHGGQQGRVSVWEFNIVKFVSTVWQLFVNTPHVKWDLLQCFYTPQTLAPPVNNYRHSRPCSQYSFPCLHHLVEDISSPSPLSTSKEVAVNSISRDTRGFSGDKTKVDLKITSDRR